MRTSRRPPLSRIDKNTPGTEPHRATLRVRATVTPANVPNLRVYFASFDLDDPSATGTPIDTTAADGVDNNGHVNSSKSGNFATATGVACTNASAGTSPLYISKITCPVSGTTTSAHFQVTMQPGDNFTVAASLSDTYRDELQVNTSAGTNLINTAGQTIPISGQPNPNGVRGIRTDMLTVWRRLHIEVDSMGQAQENYVRGNVIDGFSVDRSRTKTIPVVTDSLEPNRFENGRMELTKFVLLEANWKHCEQIVNHSQARKRAPLLE